MFWAARGVIPNYRAIIPADTIGRASTRSTRAGSREVDRRPLSFPSNRRRASSLSIGLEL